ncbi:MAG: 2-amino-4-hydroxy-6-hydroxymethyldihydropteridine diphosphokinase [Bacteroidales bacterium]
MKNIAYILLGSNLGDSRTICEQACLAISNQIGNIQKKSNFYISEAWGFKADTLFYNQVIEIETQLLPQTLLQQLLAIETDFGRTRSQAKGYQSRTLDLDILFYNQEIICTENLSIPHPLLHKRLFTLIPLAEISPNLQHPILHKTIENLLEECK